MDVPRTAASTFLAHSAAGLLALAIAACGGSGSGPTTRDNLLDGTPTPTQTPNPDNTPPGNPSNPTDRITATPPVTTPSPSLPSPRPAARLSMGSEPSGAAFSPSTQSRGGISLATASTTGLSASVLANYLQYLMRLPANADNGGITHPFGAFRSPPSVHLSAATKDSFRTIARQAVQTLNAALPTDFQIAISNDLPASTRMDDLSPGQIFVSLTANYQEWDWGWDDPEEASSLAHVRGRRDGNNIHWERRRAIIWLTEQYGTSRLYSTLLHDFIHALSAVHTPSPFVAPGSLIHINVRSVRRAIVYPPEPLPAIDAHLLHLTYSRLSPGTMSATFTASDLGPWDDQFHLRGEIADAGIEFGASTQNGIGDAWAAGPGPRTDLRANAALGSTATWRGALVGFARNDHTVVGDAAITVTLATLRGSAAFTGLESFGDRAVPGAAGTGARWGDGDLRYAIGVTGSTFRETDASADAGFLEGAFTGTGHEGAVGTLRRPDLTAAFGAVR